MAGIELDALGSEVIRADDGRIAAGVTATDVALVQYRDVCNTVVASEIVSNREPMTAGADYDNVVTVLKFPGRVEKARFWKVRCQIRSR